MVAKLNKPIMKEKKNCCQIKAKTKIQMRKDCGDTNLSN